MSPEELKKFRDILSVSQAGLGDLLGVSTRTVEAWEYGRNPIPRPVELALEFLNLKKSVADHYHRSDLEQILLHLETITEIDRIYLSPDAKTGLSTAKGICRSGLNL